MNIISLKDICKNYKEIPAIKNITIDIPLGEGEIAGLVGPNGSGKTTLMKIVNGLLAPSSGTIALNTNGKTYIDKKYSGWVKDNISYVPAGEKGMLNKLSIYDNTMYYGVLKGEAEERVKEKIKIYSNLLKIEDLLARRIEQLSTGQKKKAQLLCVLCSGSKVLLLDEPSLGLDIDSNINLIEAIKIISTFEQISILISSHDTELLSELAEYFYFMIDGEIKKVIQKDLNFDLKTYYKKFIKGRKAN